MAESLVEGLSGTEVIDDILAQIRRKIQTSCNFSHECNYGQGFSAEINIKIKAYAMDVTEEEFNVIIPAKVEPPVSTEETIVTPLEISESIEIPQELDLEIVRERIKEPDPLPPPDEMEESRMPARLKRKYTRRTGIPSLEQAASGGAVDLDSDEAKF
jgi:hypothetical protein